MHSVHILGAIAMANWTASNIPSQSGRTAVITGTGGLGLEDALALARAGASVIIAGRSRSKGEAALSRIRSEVPSANVAFGELDLADLKSVARFSADLATRHDSIDLLINNAGVMVPPTRQETVDGFELQFATNYLGHFALTAGLLPLLRRGRAPRVVSLSSVAARAGKIDFADLQSTNYVPMTAYGQSKIACLMFAFELQRRSDAAGWGITSIAAHPGVSRTDLLHNAPGKMSINGLARTYLWFLFQPAWQGALPTLFAATDPTAKPGGYYGPDRLGETRGHPAPSRIPEAALDKAAAKRLFDESETLAGIRFADNIGA